MNQHFERKGCFSTASCEVLREFCTEGKTGFSLLCHAYNYDIDAYVCNVWS